MRQNSPSSTARLVALVRAALSATPQKSPLYDPYAQKLLPLPMQLVARAFRVSLLSPLLRGLDRGLVGVISHLAGRTCFFDEKLKEAIDDGVRQVVILGAGYDTRALRFKAPGLRFFEVDHPATQADKKARLLALETRASSPTERDAARWRVRKASASRRAGVPGGTSTTNNAADEVAPQVARPSDYLLASPGEHSSIRLVPVDFTRDDLRASLKQAGFLPTEKTFFLWEGVTMYLSEEQVRATLRTLHELSAPQSLLALEVMAHRMSTPLEEVARFLGGFGLSLIGEPFRFGSDPALLEELLSQEGWLLRELEGSDALSRRYLQESFLKSPPVGPLGYVAEALRARGEG